MESEDMGQVVAQSGGSHWEVKAEKLLEDWRARVYAAQSAHYRSAGLFRLLNYFVGVPAVVFSSVVGTAIFAGLKKDSSWALWVGVVSIGAAVLAGLQTFFRFSERAAQHETAADWYSAIRRDIEEIQHLPDEYRGEPKVCFDKLRKEMNRIVQTAPAFRVKYWSREVKRFGVNEPEIPGPWQP
jgi:hypothetical protein